jgi:hypothetical protein
MELDAKTAALMNFAGFALAHGVGGVSSGKTLCTMALVQCQKEQGLSQYPGPVGQSVAQAKAATEGLDDLQRRAIIFDGMVTVGGTESSAVVVEAAWKDHLTRPLVVIQRYRSSPSGTDFAVVGEPMIATAPDDEVEIAQREAVMEGARTHDEAFAVWMKALEE